MQRSRGAVVRQKTSGIQLSSHAALTASFYICGVCGVGAGEMPNGSEENFTESWKAWIKATGAKLKKKGKGLFHPIRYAPSKG